MFLQNVTFFSFKSKSTETKIIDQLQDFKNVD